MKNNNNNNLIIEHQPQGVVSLTINRPEVGNAFDDELIKALLNALTDLEQSDTRLLILKSAGKHFSTGADLNWMQHARHLTREENLADARQLAELMRRLDQFPAPTLALVQGAAYGGALGLIAACDMVICADNARFCLSEVKIGLVPATISPYVVGVIGARQARRYFLSAEVINAQQALSMELVHELCPENALINKAEAFTRTDSRQQPSRPKSS